MSSLTGQKVKESYKSLIKTEATTGFNSNTPTRIEDGDGNHSAVHLGKSALHISGSAGINISATSIPSANLHIISTATKSILVENSDGYDKFYIGDTNSSYNVKLGDIDATSPGNNNYMCIEDNNNKAYFKTTNFGVNNTVPTSTLHVGNYSGTANFSLGSDTSAFKVGKSDNTELFKVDTENEKVVINGDLEMTGTGSFRKSTQRIELEEYFQKLPTGNSNLVIDADADDAAALVRYVIANKDFELLGTDAANGTIRWEDTGDNEGGVLLQTHTDANDQMIVAPHTDTNQTMWANGLWVSQKQVIWEGAIKSGGSIADTSFWAGLKKTNDAAYGTDDDQAYFLYSADDTQGALTTNANLHFVYSVGGTDYITDLGLAVAADTVYRLRIEIDINRKVSVFVNDTQYGLVTSSTAGGATQSVSTTKSNALTSNVPLFAFVGVETLGSAAKHIMLFYERISRIIG